MTHEAQRIAIAVACGWNNEPFSAKGDRAWINYTGWGASAIKPDWNFVHQLPDYLNDLDASRAAVYELIYMNHDLTVRYEKSLCDAIKQPLIATAAQQMEHTLRTIGKWVE